MTPTPHLVVLCTVPDAATGERIAEALVEERLAACVNLVPGLRSFYRWKGKLQREAELLLVIKTRAERLDALMERLKSLHPYEVPEILALPIAAGSEAYLLWIEENTV
jgi:periplasmic divalent cation tolerance protein